jgi:hypothetical protein
LCAHTAARGTHDSRALDWSARDEDRFPDHGSMGWSAGSAAEVHAKVAMAVVVHAVRETMSRVGA